MCIKALFGKCTLLIVIVYGFAQCTLLIVIVYRFALNEVFPRN